MIRLSALLIALLAAVSISNPSVAAKRVALVIGNGAYVDATPLTNPANDASDIALKLEGLGFSVVKGTDLDHKGMRDVVRRFSAEVEGADVALFFYAGHALQVDGVNHLAPIDARLEREGDLDFESISLELVRRQMERHAKTNIVFLDACRDNPLTRRFARSTGSSAGSGLARFEPGAQGTFIAFATQPDNVALDGKGRNSPFTEALLKHIDEKGVEISAMMTNVRRDVYEATEERQLPWTNSSLLGLFYFNPAPEPVAKNNTAKSGAADGKTAVEAVDKKTEVAALETGKEAKANASGVEKASEESAWRKIEESNDPAKYAAFLALFPDGNFAAEAKTKLDGLSAAQKSQTESAAKPAEQSETGATATKDAVVAGLDERGLARSIQGELDRLGCEPGKADGLWGARSRDALSRFGRHGGIEIATLEPSADVLSLLQKSVGRICPLACKPVEEQKNGECVPKSCAAGFTLQSSGTCVALADPKSQSANAGRKRSEPVTKTVQKRPVTKTAVRNNRVAKPSGACFRFNGQLICD